ncbi:phosphodiester glycosidase family protein [Propionibacteriaceae bacterium G57]|uniref:phosphodiester glycosidase family protein n=1 Tax=Aestuariimicrobium sp. G57 TaxID=3418485 RepID=UPI003DA6F7DA
MPIDSKRLSRAAVAVVTGLALAVGLAPLAPAWSETTPTATTVVQGLDGADSALLDSHDTQLAPGLSMTSFQRRQGRAWVGGQVLTMDTTAANLSLDVVDGGAVAGRNKTVSQFATEAGNDVVAAVNGDFFDMNATDAPVHGNIGSNGVRSLTRSSLAFTMTQGKAAIETLMSNSQLVRLSDNTTTQVDGVNTPGSYAVTVYNSAWGNYRLDGVAGNGDVVVLYLRDGVVEKVSTDKAALQTISIAEGEAIVLGRGQQGRDMLAGYAVGDQVRLDVKANLNADLAVGGNIALVTNGELTTENQVTAGRTAVGISQDGSKLFLVAIDGRRADADGQTIAELAQLMKDIGAWNAINLDGGGSTTMVGRPAGTDQVQVLNTPSDGNERLVSNALVIRSSARPTLTGVQARPASAEPTNAEAQHLELMPGLTRTVRATGLDGNGRPVASYGAFSAGPQVGISAVAETATVTGKSTGSGTLTYAAGQYSAQLPFTVHGAPTQLVPSTRLVALSSPDDQGTLRLAAADADGNTAPVEIGDVTITTTGDVAVEPSSLDSWRVIGTKNGSGTITLSAGGLQTKVAVTIGTVDQTVSDFSDPSLWTKAYARATGTMVPATGPNGEPALRMQYDFTTSTSTRGAYANAAPNIPVAGQPQSLSLWINGDGTGVWPRIQVRRGDGTSTNVDGPNVTWTGWRKVSFTIPTGTAYPLQIMAIRMMETRSTVKYHGDVTIAGLTAQVPADVEIPQVPYVHDPVIMTTGTVDGRPLRIAVMSDGQFVGRNPDSALVASMRRTLREIVAAKPDMLVINGDFVDESNDIDFELAKKILDEEVGDKLPYQYVPGNHEIMGQPISNFEKWFGDTRSVHDLKGTRLITLDSSSGHLHPDGVSQLQFLEQQLAAAQADDSITGVLVFHHHPVDDPTPGALSQLSDRTEAAAVQRLLGRFRAQGKQVASINGHVGAFHADAVDGVSRLINGNSGKSPSGPTDQGGWSGWTMLGIDPAKGGADRTAWLQAETHAHVDELAIKVADQAVTTVNVNKGDVVNLTGVLTQAGRQVDVRWPVTSQWSGERVLVTTDAELPADAGDVGFRLNPSTGELAWNGGGSGALTLTVNGTSVTVVITSNDSKPVPAGETAATDKLGDHTGDGLADVYGIDRSGHLQFFRTQPNGKPTWAGAVGTGWGQMTAMTQINDLTGDKRSDLLVRRGTDNSLWLYAGGSNGYVSVVRQVGQNWGGMDIIAPVHNLGAGPGQYVVARRAADGALFRYRLTPGGLVDVKRVGQHWGDMTQLVGAGDLTGDGIADLLAIRTDGTLWRYAGKANGTIDGGVQVGRGWQGFTRAFVAGDLTGDGRYDLLGQRADGKVFLYANLVGQWGQAREVMSGTTGYLLMA